MDYGAHLPLMDFGGNPYTLDHLIDYAKTADALGFQALSMNDHLVFSVPWLDGPTALAAVMSYTGDMTLATTVSLPIVRGPVALAKTLGAIDRLSGGRMMVAIGPGSSQRDYAAVGIDFDERWKRLDEAVQALRAMWQDGSEPFVGQFYNTEDMTLEPYPAQSDGPPIWIGSWGSEAGLRRTARLADGWLASAYNTTPTMFAEGLERLGGFLRDNGKDPATFPNALATMWFYIADGRREAEKVFQERLVKNIHRSEEDLRARLPFGSAEDVAKKLRAYQDAGVQRIFMWPVVDEVRQLERFAERVVPLIES